MAYMEFKWEAWDIDAPSVMKRYLEINSRMRSEEGVTERRPIIDSNYSVAGKMKKYYFEDKLNIIYFEYNDGSGEIAFFGESGELMDEKLKTLKSMLGYQELKPATR